MELFKLKHSSLAATNSGCYREGLHTFNDRNLYCKYFPKSGPRVIFVVVDMLSITMNQKLWSKKYCLW